MKKLLLPFLMCFMLCSCAHTEPSAPFIDSDTIQLLIAGRSILNYNALDCQKSYDSQNNEFTVCTDDGGRYYSIRLSQIPTSEHQQVVSYIEWTTTLGSLRSKNNIVLDVVKIKDDKIWLWNAAQQIEACVQLIR